MGGEDDVFILGARDRSRAGGPRRSPRSRRLASRRRSPFQGRGGSSKWGRGFPESAASRISPQDRVSRAGQEARRPRAGLKATASLRPRSPPSAGSASTIEGKKSDERDGGQGMSKVLGVLDRHDADRPRLAEPPRIARRATARQAASGPGTSGGCLSEADDQLAPGVEALVVVVADLRDRQPVSEGRRAGPRLDEARGVDPERDHRVVAEQPPAPLRPSRTSREPRQWALSIVRDLSGTGWRKPSAPRGPQLALGDPAGQDIGRLRLAVPRGRRCRGPRAASIGEEGSRATTSADPSWLRSRPRCTRSPSWPPGPPSFRPSSHRSAVLNGSGSGRGCPSRWSPRPRRNPAANVADRPPRFNLWPGGKRPDHGPDRRPSTHKPPRPRTGANRKTAEHASRSPARCPRHPSGHSRQA